MNVTLSTYTVRELKRQLGFHKTMYRQHEEKHQAKQAEKLATIAKLEKAVTAASELEEMEINL